MVLYQPTSQTDGQTDYMRSQDRALHYNASHGKNCILVHFSVFTAKWSPRLSKITDLNKTWELTALIATYNVDLTYFVTGRASYFAMSRVTLWSSYSDLFQMEKNFKLLYRNQNCSFLADRTIGRAYGTVCRLSVCNVRGSWPHRLKILETNCTNN